MRMGLGQGGSVRFDAPPDSGVRQRTVPWKRLSQRAADDTANGVANRASLTATQTSAWAQVTAPGASARACATVRAIAG